MRQSESRACDLSGDILTALACSGANETFFSLSSALMSCEASWVFFARPTRTRSTLPVWNSISPECITGCFAFVLAAGAELLPAEDASAPLFEKAAASLEGDGGPKPAGGAFATGRELTDQPGIDGIPVGGAFGGIAATTISSSLVGYCAGRQTIHFCKFLRSPQPVASRIAMAMHPAYAMPPACKTTRSTNEAAPHHRRSSR